MSDKAYQHTPVMLKETIELLNVKPGGTYVDCTLGGGGHAEAILKGLGTGGWVLGMDSDAEAIEAAKIRLSGHQNIEFIRDNFRNLKKILTRDYDGILLDLGVSSYQLDEASRGFSLRKDGPLDMRLDQSLKLTAAAIVNEFNENELVRIFSEFGEERFAKRISKAICVFRDKKRIETTFQLKEIIEKAIPTWKKRESVTRIFQALRIAVNDELQSMEKALIDAIDLLKPGGRLVVISYHSLEDRLVKQALRQAKQDKIMNILTKKPLRPTSAESSSNPRSRSAKLRAGEKL